MSREGDFSSQTKVKILMVDDRPENLTALEAVLEDLEQELVRAGSGPDALRHLLADDFAVILLDVRMPGMDGFETAALIRERDRCRSTPIIFLTAHSEEQSQSFRGYDLGAVDYLVKPIVPEVLRSKVAVFVELQKNTQFLRQHATLLESKNVELEHAIARRKQAEEEVRSLNDHLEERLAELQAANRDLENLYEKVKELHRLKSEFFANASHELRTPLALVLGPTEKLLAHGHLTEEQRRNIELVERNTHVLLKHVNDLLAVSKLDSGNMEMEYSESDLANLVVVTAAHFDGLAQQRGIAFAVRALASQFAQVDAEKVRRVLLNLLSNAFKFAPDGGTIDVSVETENGRVRIKVRDNGPGIPPEFREVIFERFRQVNLGPAKQFGGTGLGLSIAREFVEMHGGRITVADAPGAGALFTVELPQVAPPGTKIALESAASAETQALTRQTVEELRASLDAAPLVLVKRSAAAQRPNGRPLLLVIEDNPAMAGLLADTLGSDYQVETARDGEEGLSKALALGPDLILSDIMMPRMGGDDLLRRIRAYPELEGVPVVLLTARDDQQLRTSLLREGAHDYLVKPFSVAEMCARLANLIAMKRTRDVLEKELGSRDQDVEKLARQLAQRKREVDVARAEAETASRAKDEFLAMVSHELRTPLTAILGWSRLLRAGSLDEETASRAVETIERNAKIQAQIIEEILDMSRIISGKMRLSVGPVELSPVIEAAINAVGPAAEAKGVSLHASLDPGVGPVSGDGDRLQQVIWNLLSNAIKFTPKGGRVEVRLGRVGSQVEISVSDTGKGISPDFLPHVFERFRQADGGTTRAHAGLGLGLAIVRHLVELHGGSVQAESAGEGKGAVFTVRLPVAALDFSRARLSAEAPEAIADLEGVQVLVVDDEPDTRELLSRVLGNCGAEVRTAGSAAEALQLVEKSSPDVLLSDIQMPGEDGYCLIQKIRALEREKGLRIRAAALTAYVTSSDRTQALSAGFEAHVAKPVEPAELAAVVAQLAKTA